MNEEIEKAIKFLNENNYVVIPVSKGQMCLCDACAQPEEECRYNSIGHACTNLRCLNSYIKEQIDYQAIIENIE